MVVLKKKHPDHAFMIRVLNGRLLVSPLACLNHLAGDFVPQYEAGRRGGSATNHMLVATTNVGGDYFEDYPVLA